MMMMMIYISLKLPCWQTVK